MSSVIDSIKDIILHSLVKPCIARSKLEGEKLLSVFTLFLVLISFFGNVNASEVVFNSTGALQTFTVPSGVTAIDVKMWGAGGGGGFSSGILSVIPGETLSIIVGGKGTAPDWAIGGAGGFGGGGTGGNGVANAWDCGGFGSGGRSEIVGSNGIITAGGGGGVGCGGVMGATTAGGGNMGQTGLTSACYNTSGGSGFGGGAGVGGAGGAGCYNGVYGQGNGAAGNNTDGGKGGDDPGGLTLPWMGPRGRGGGGGGGFGGGGGGGASDSWSAVVGGGCAYKCRFFKKV